VLMARTKHQPSPAWLCASEISSTEMSHLAHRSGPRPACWASHRAMHSGSWQRLQQHHVAAHGNAIIHLPPGQVSSASAPPPVPTASSFASFLFFSRVRARLIGRVATLN
jgi:hypothetical protein